MKSSLFPMTTTKKSFAQKMSLMASTAAVLAFPEAADAAIVHVTGSPITAFTANNDVIDWDIDQDSIVDANLIAGTNTAAPFNPYMVIESVTNSFLASVAPATFSPMINLPTNYFVASIGYPSPVGVFTGASNFLINSAFPTATSIHWQDDVPGFIGFSFNTGCACSQVFGWASVTVDLGNSITINEWAYDTTGEPIRVGVTSVPEGDNVAGLALLSMGAAGIRAWRKRKQKINLDGMIQAVSPTLSHQKVS